jgi:hypothetical protein
MTVIKGRFDKDDVRKEVTREREKREERERG